MRAAKIVERLLAAIPVMLGVAVLTFVFVRLTPGDPVDVMMGQGGSIAAGELDRLREEFNLDKPIHVQLGIFLGDLVRGDLGYSYSRRLPVTQIIAERLPATIELAGVAMVFALVVAIPIGIISAVRPGSFLDRFSMGSAFLGISMPSFWLGIMLILLFSVTLHWLPVQGRISSGVAIDGPTGLYLFDTLLARRWSDWWDALRHLILPAVTLGIPVAAIIARVLRGSMLETLRSDYVDLARSKGATSTRVVLKHALRNALIPTVTVVGLQVGVLLGGNMIIETVFGWPGLGRTVVEAIFNRDFPLVQGCVMVYGFTYVAANLTVDIAYTYLNPRIVL
jgi:peptide/nickel transport system permease protein